jgi:hypothetical protein
LGVNPSEHSTASGEVENNNPVILPNLRSGHADPADSLLTHLALRSETKARDVFDLDLLFRRRRASDGGRPALSGAYAKDAAQRALEVSYASYRSEVLSFIEPAVREVYEPESTWDQLRRNVVEELEGLAAKSDGEGGP